MEKFAAGVACEADRASVQRGKEGEQWKAVPAPQGADGRAGYRMAARTTARRAVIMSFSCDSAIPTTAAQTVARSYFYASPALGVNARFCRDPRFGMSQISWRTSVAHHPTEDSRSTAQPRFRCRSRAAGLWRRSAGAKGKGGAAEPQGSRGATADLTRGPLAAAPSGSCGRSGRPPDRGQAYSRRPRVKSAAPPEPEPALCRRFRDRRASR
jgi:hypothetical protein